MVDAIPILTFHAIDNRPSVISFPPRLFQRAMAHLCDAGYRAVSLPELNDCLRRRGPFPQRTFAITFDDGYHSVYRYAFPVLQRYGFPATVFLTVGQNSKKVESERLSGMSDRSMLSWGEIKEMHRWGMAFGAHTLTHPNLTRLRCERVEAEVVGGKAVIEDALGAEVISFAYPFGCYDKQCREIVSRHFICAFSDKLGLVGANSDPYAIERVDSYYLRSERLFTAMGTTFFPIYIRARAVARQLRRSMYMRSR